MELTSLLELLLTSGIRFNALVWKAGGPDVWALPAALSTMVSGAEIGELRSIERALKLQIARKQINHNRQRSSWVLRNTLPTRTLSRMPGEVFS